ncbi:dnaJ homolog subfamily C member 10 [Diachasma alloeum]|uniref:dnaJ homolog subfamily C member 10 n=1 Tax=Diachasma alloeum TaxID=454923 RepID=UPI00073822F2|nr:dnaJ homolog subfamily C member 10 [Diachasma alloeum]
MFIRGIVILLVASRSFGEDYYELLGLERNADQKTIRQAFKKLAVTHHPDKNSEDPEAHIKFIKYTTAYEVLKDPDLRKKYDLYGQEGLNDQNTQQNYHSWSYYQDNFGIYDDDPQVVTLNKNDYHDNVINSEKIWMINFYSPMCSHCRTLAPSWRKIAKDFEGVIRVGAVNCEDDWSLCRQLGIQSYPTLLFYPRNSQHGIGFTARKNYDEISEFIMSSLDVNLEKLSQSSFNRLMQDSRSREKSWLIFTCGKNRKCFKNEDQLKISAIFENILTVGIFNCDKNHCNDLPEFSTSAVFIPGGTYDSKSPVLFEEFENIDILVHQVLEQLPEPKEITANDFEEIKDGFESDSEGWLLCFYIGHATELDLLLKRLPGIIQDVNFGKVNCGRYQALCSALSINRYPMWGVLKPSGAFELNHGKGNINDIAKFAENSIKAQNVWALSASKILAILQRKIRSEEVWFLDWYAPWCPPCMQFLPELRKASLHFQKSTINFGTVDCTVHLSICRQYNIRSYPTAMLINGSATSQFTLQKTARNIIEFIKESMNPTVIKLNSTNFHKTLGRKKSNSLWVVDYFAPWCGPCQQLAPEWTSVAKVIHLLPNVKIASVDCEADGDLCRTQGVRSYPTIRLYPIGSEGLNQVAMYNGNRDATSLMRWIVKFLGIKVKEFTEHDLERKAINNKKEVWVIDYYAPWCGHCQVLEPHFVIAAQMLEGKAKFGRLNCDEHRSTCRRAGVNAYPTVFIYKIGDQRLNGGKKVEGTTAEAIRDEVMVLMKDLGRHDEL